VGDNGENTDIAGGAELTLYKLRQEIEALPPHSVRRGELQAIASALQDSIRHIRNAFRPPYGG